MIIPFRREDPIWAALARRDARAVCTPPAKNDVAVSLAAPVASGPGVCIPAKLQALARKRRNASEWRHVAEFLDAQHLASLGLRRVARVSEAVELVRALAPACSAAAVRSLPDGNHGDNNLRTVSEVA